LLWNKKKDEQRESIETCIPHDKKPYSKSLSLIKFLIFNLDYILGYWLKVKKQIGQGKLVVFDRYYYDYYIDRYRYRLNITDEWLEMFQWMIPKPDITFVLTGTPEIIYKRKRELPIVEIEEQIKRLELYAPNFENSKMICVDGNIDEIVEQVCREILNLMLEKRKK
jgi:thymidylate kinase